MGLEWRQEERIRAHAERVAAERAENERLRGQRQERVGIDPCARS
jgi:hypothetical protein